MGGSARAGRVATPAASASTPANRQRRHLSTLIRDRIGARGGGACDPRTRSRGPLGFARRQVARSERRYRRVKWPRGLGNLARPEEVPCRSIRSRAPSSRSAAGASRRSSARASRSSRVRTRATRSHDTEYPFRQDSDLWYLTGFEQPEAVAVFTQSRFTFFVQPRDPVMETWNGRRPGVEGAVSRFGADEAFPIGELRGEAAGPAREQAAALAHLRARPGARRPGDRSALRRARARPARRDRAERDRLAARPDPRDAAAQVEPPSSRSCARRPRSLLEAHHCAAHACKAGTHEYELEAELLRVFRKRGGLAPAYNPIVGTGDNATILHYVENRDPLAGRAARADRRGGRATRLCVGRDARLSGRRPLRGRGARRVPGGARRAARGLPRGRAGREPAGAPRGGAAPARGGAGRAGRARRATSTS